MENLPNQNSGQTEPKSGFFKQYGFELLLGLVLLLVITNVITFLIFYSQKNNKQDLINQPADEVAENVNNTPEENLVPEAETISIDWLGRNVEVSPQDFFAENMEKLRPIISEVRQSDYAIEPFLGTVNKIFDSAEKFIDQFTIYKVGSISSGQYTSKDLYLLQFDPGEVPFGGPTLHRIIKDGNDLILLSKVSESPYYSDLFEKIFAQDENILISNMDTVNEIAIPNSNIKLYRIGEEPFKLITDYDDLTPLVKYDGEHYLYKSNTDGCFVVFAVDGTAREYAFGLDFLKGNMPQDSDSGFFLTSPIFNAAVLDVNWSTGARNKSEYNIVRVGGCGVTGCYNYVDYITNLDQLVEVGQSDSGEVFYELKDASFKAGYNDADGVLQSMYNYYYIPESQKKLSFDEFVADHPLVFWQDSFGQFIAFQKVKYVPAVECGKPVIYLYPEKEMDVSVKVSPTGGISLSDPEYGNGWSVKASPSGELYNYSDKKYYPYLFWEGFGLDYQMPEQGFVIARENVHKFLLKKLPELGLNANEYNEFIDFWLPKMQDKNYYFITFVPQEEFDVLAPLEVSPKPDTVIRVFMDFKGLDEYREVEPQVIKTPERDGFSVVEWGGTLHDYTPSLY